MSNSRIKEYTKTGNMKNTYQILAVIVSIGTLASVCLAGDEKVVFDENFSQKGGIQDWVLEQSNGSTGEIQYLPGKKQGDAGMYRLTKTNALGKVLFYNSKDLPVMPGKSYVIEAELRLVEGETNQCFLRTTFSGGSRVGSLKSNSLTMPGGWLKLSLPFQSWPNENGLRAHVVMGSGKGVVEVRGITLKYKPPRFEPVANEVLPPLEPARKIVAARKRAEAHVEVRDGRPRVVVDGNLTPPAFVILPGDGLDKAQVGDLKKAGVHVYIVSLWLGRGVWTPNDIGPWLGPDKYDFSGVDDLLWRILRVDPEGYVIFDVVCDPYRDWGVDHPDEVAQDQHGNKAIVDMHLKRFGEAPANVGERFGQSLLSEVLRRETAETLQQLAAYIQKSEPGKAVIGYHLSGALDAQWLHWSNWSPNHLSDYSPGAQRSFRNWLRRLYKDDVSALRRAWNRLDVTFDTASIPSAERRWPFDGPDITRPDKFFLIDAAIGQDVIDHNRFHSEGITETVMYLAQALRETTGGKAILGTYYADISSNHGVCHIALGRYLNSNVIDYFGSSGFRCRTRETRPSGC